MARKQGGIQDREGSGGDTAQDRPGLAMRRERGAWMTAGRKRRDPGVSAHTTSGKYIQGLNSGNFQNHLYRGRTWTHTNPSYVAILSHIQGYCEPEAPSEQKGSSLGKSTEEPCSSDVYSLKALPP